METTVLEAALRRWNSENEVQKVISIIKEPAVAKGENFTSTVTRLTANVMLGNGRQTSKHFILKESKNEGTLTSHICRTSGIFKFETLTYQVVLKGMEDLMDEFEDTDGPLWCQLVHHEPFKSILLEDLSDLGYRVVKRQIGLDLEHGILALRKLAKFHAMAKVLEERSVILKNDHVPMALIADPKVIRIFFYHGFRAVSRGIKKYWGNKWTKIADKLNVPERVMQEKMLKLGKLDENRFNVRNHGDCWTNNLMFKYNWKNHPISIRFLDFQAPHYNSPALDITFFLYLSMIPIIRRNHFNDLIENYYQALLLSFEKYQYKGNILTMQELRREMERVSFFGMSMFTIRHAAYTSEGTDGIDLEKIFATGGKEGLNIDVFNNLTLIDSMGPDLKDIVECLSR